MKNKNLLTLISLLVTAVLFLGPSTGQTDKYAGAPGDQGTNATCANCHSGGTGGGSVSLVGMPSTYTAGQTYPLTLFIYDANAPKAGYQIVATDNVTNAQIGSFQNYPANSQMAASGRLTHNTPATFLSGAVSWSFNWVAPSSGPPSTVKFYYVGNAVDGTGGTGGDFVYAGFTTAALPIELAHFSAKTAENYLVQLDWKTFSETHNAQFSIERSLGDGPFETIGTIKGSGTTTEPRAYSFRDRPAVFEKTTAHYRLLQTDFDGRSTHSKIVSSEIGGSPRLEVWPNIAPAGEAITLRFSGIENADRIEVFDYSGNSVFAKNVQTEDGEVLSIPTDGWSTGQFFVKISGGGAVRAVPFFVL